MPDLEQEVEELKKRVAQLETRLDNQYEWNQQLLRRITKLESGANGGQFVPTASIMGE